MTTKTVTLVALAKTAKVSPKVARGKLRRAGWKPTKDGWQFSGAKVTEARKLIAA